MPIETLYRSNDPFNYNANDSLIANLDSTINYDFNDVKEDLDELETFCSQYKTKLEKSFANYNIIMQSRNTPGLFSRSAEILALQQSYLKKLHMGLEKAKENIELIYSNLANIFNTLKTSYQIITKILERTTGEFNPVFDTQLNIIMTIIKMTPEITKTNKIIENLKILERDTDKLRGCIQDRLYPFKSGNECEVQSDTLSLGKNNPH